MSKRILLLILSSFSIGHLVAQQRLSVATNAISSSSTDKGIIYYANKNEPPRAIEFKERAISSSSFLTNINSYFNIPNEHTFTELESNTDNLGMKHRLLQQNYKGIPLEGMGYRVHEKNGFVTSANGKAVRSINLDPQITLSEQQAFHLAKQYLQTKDTTARQGKKLIVSKDFTFTPESFSIAFQFDIDVSLIERWRVSIDARNGQLINKVSLVNSCFNEKEIASPLPYGTGTGLTNYYGNKTIRVEKYDGGSSRLVGQTEHGGTIGTYDFRNVNVVSLLLFWEFHKVYDFYSLDNTYNDPYYRSAVSVQWAAEQAYEYYFKKHNRNSFDNLGSEIKSYVRIGNFFDNALWNGKVLAFGEGSNNNPLVELDVVSHELTHGVTQYEANLQYYNESGALNESFSDIFAKAVEFDTFGDTATWQLSKHFQEGGLRDFSNPNLKNQPDTYFGNRWYTGFEDGGGVHTNSGVQNFWYYLLCNGGSGVNDQQVSYSVNAIGMDAATKIAYRNLTEYLSPFSDYLDSRIGSLLAADDLYGKNSTYKEVDKAWDAVGVVDEPIITSLNLYDITATTVKIKGSLIPRGDNVTYHFEYGTTPAFGSSSSVYKYTDKVEGIVTGLQSKTKYYLRLVATNQNGSSYSFTEFTTISLAPLVKVKQTVDVTEATATLYGQINPNSLPTSFYFEYGLTPSLDLTTPSYTLPDTTEFLNVSTAIADLQSHKTYYYRLVATNGFASSASESASFFTAVKPVISSYTPKIAPVGTEVIITGQNFNATREKNLVSFGATRATVLSASSTEIKVKVPAGASLGPIALLDGESGLSAQSVQEFVPTFTGEFKKSDLQLRVGISDLSVYQALVQDIDGDGKPDIVARHNQGFSVYQNVNQGGDITDESFIRNTFNSEYTPGILSLVDFDGNGLKDIVGSYQNIVGGYQSGLRIWPNFSVPGFIFFGVPVDLPLEYLGGNTAFSDLDRDGHIDIASTIYDGKAGTTQLVILRNQNPKGYLSANNFEQHYSKVLPYYIYKLYSDDLNNDGKPELLASIFDKNFIPILRNNSRPGTFEFEENNIQNSTSLKYPQYVSQDLNQDGWKDITSQSIYGSEILDIAIRENNGTEPNITLRNPVVVLGGLNRSVFQPGDINGDGKVDLLISTTNGKFMFLKNKATAVGQIIDSSFEKFEEYGIVKGSIESQLGIAINDLNGDGRPEIINEFSYNTFQHEGYYMEIWQNSPPNCLDPSKISLNVSSSSATIVLPPNTTFGQFEIEYAISGYNNWYKTDSPTFYLSSGYSYQLRVRAKCYLGFTDYYYINFVTDCQDTNNFSITSIGVNSVTVNAWNLNYLEIQYSQAGKNLWEALPQNANQISNLLPGTTYDLRIRGRCNAPTQFNYRQFTTLCSKLATLTISSLLYNKAVVSWTSSYTGNAVLEYSSNNVDWNLIDGSRTMFPLIAGKQYFVRGKLACANANSDFIYTSFTTPCPKVSTINTDAVTPFSAKINWVDESHTNNYILTYSIAPGGKVTTIETSSTFFNLDGLSPGTQYAVTIAPQCIATKDFTSMTFNTVCYVPFNLSANDITYTTAELSWDDTFGGTPYSIDYSILGRNSWQTTKTALTNTSLAGLRPGTKYEARVHITCQSVAAPYASLIFETNLYAETTFAPNPSDSKTTIYPSKNLIGSHFSIYDTAGKMIISGELLDYIIDLTNFSIGIYTLKIDGEKPMKMVKH
jgi:Zn-dependent metalloprotease